MKKLRIGSSRWEVMPKNNQECGQAEGQRKKGEAANEHSMNISVALENNVPGQDNQRRDDQGCDLP